MMLICTNMDNPTGVKRISLLIRQPKIGMLHVLNSLIYNRYFKQKIGLL